jgi:hypothetical protein
MKMARFPIGQAMIVRSTIVSRSTIVIVVWRNDGRPTDGWEHSNWWC